MGVTPDDVRRMAALARIGVPEERLVQLVGELDGILVHMAALAQVTARAPDTVTADGMPLAPDEPMPLPLTRRREAFAPDMRDGYFVVPRLATHEDGPGSA